MGNMEKEERGTVESSISPKRQLPRDQALGCRSQYPSLPHSSGVMTTGVSVTTPGQPYDTQIYQCQQPYVPSATSESPSSEMVYAERHTYSQRCEQLSYYQAPSSYGSPITLGSHALGSVSPYQPGAMEHQPFMGESDALLDHGPGYFSTMGPGNPVTMPLLEQYVTQVRHAAFCMVLVHLVNER